MKVKQDEVFGRGTARQDKGDLPGGLFFARRGRQNLVINR
jgi:hypothetical protein